VLLAGIGWLGVFYFAGLWNRSFRLSLWHHGLCGVASFVVVISVPVCVLSYSLERSLSSVGSYLQKKISDTDFQQKVCVEIDKDVKWIDQQCMYDKSRKMNIDRKQMSSDSASVRVAAHAYIERSILAVGDKYPQIEPLVRYLSGQRTAILSDMLRPLFASGNLSSVMYEKVASEISAKISKALLDPLKLWAGRIRIMAILLVLIFQSLAFGLTGLSAVRALDI